MELAYANDELAMRNGLAAMAVVQKAISIAESRFVDYTYQARFEILCT